MFIVVIGHSGMLESGRIDQSYTMVRYTPLENLPSLRVLHTGQYTCRYMFMEMRRLRYMYLEVEPSLGVEMKIYF